MATEMIKLVKLQASQGETLYGVNPLLVTFVQSTEEAGVCVVHFTGGSHVTVQAAYDEVLALLAAG